MRPLFNLLKAGRVVKADSIPLKPFLFRTRDGFLLGASPDPSIASPCSGCIEKWLRSRNVWLERAELSELTLRRDLIAELLLENTPHTLFEIHREGEVTRLDSLVFPHKDCSCNRKTYIAQTKTSQKTNFAFSPIHQIKCVRYGSTQGNLWWTQATGESPLTGSLITTQAVERDREDSRSVAIDKWLRKAAEGDLLARQFSGEKLKSESLQSGLTEPAFLKMGEASFVTGAGSNENEARLDAFQTMAKLRTIKNYASSGKNPMLIVGTNNWVRGRVPFFLLQQYDLHFFFYPNAMPVWIVGLALLSRVSTDEKPLFFFGASSNSLDALDRAIFQCLETVKPPSVDELPTLNSPSFGGGSAKLQMWWINWVYRCPKIPSKDVLHLEPYPKTAEVWYDFFKDGEPKVSLHKLNHSLLPTEIRTLSAIESPILERLQRRNVRGIGSLSAYLEMGA